MAIVEHPLEALKQYIPLNSFQPVVNYIHGYKIHLTVTKKRKSVLGDYRHPFMGKNHRISINGNLNQYEFLITFLHELAHLLTYVQYGNRVEAHGQEWKTIYSNLLAEFIQLQVFPDNVVNSLKKSIANPAATANGETELLKVLRQYNVNKNPALATLESLATGSLFKTEKGHVFKKGLIRRKRYECLQINTGRLYSFSPIAEVMPITAS